MTEGALAALRNELGGKPPKAVAALDDEHLQALADAIAKAKQRQARALEKATDEAFDNLPRLLRGPVRKILGA